MEKWRIFCAHQKQKPVFRTADTAVEKRVSELNQSIYRLGKTAVAVLVLFARAAGTRVIAADMRKDGGI